MRNDVVSLGRFPRVPNDRRVAAFAIDFGTASLLSSVGGASLIIPLFLLSWYGLRVILVMRNHGQSLGRWALDMKVIDPKFRTIPGLVELSKRETVLGLESLLVFVSLVNLNPANGWILVAPLLLLVDCGLAFVDDDYRQAWHDRIARTVVVQTRRGYSLDLKVKKLFGDFRRRVK